MSVDNSAVAIPGTELIATMTGSPVLIGTLPQIPAIIIFDNLSSVPVVITIGDIQWKTFAAGSALVLDLRAAHGNARNFAFPAGSSIYGNGASGDFSVSYIYAKDM